MKTCDLHTHSVFSDGTWTPAQLIDEAERVGLGAVALTDHNTVDGLKDFLAAARGREVEAVPGVEFSTDYNGIELHILALFVRPEHYAPITGLLADAQRRKDEANAELVAALNRAGYSLDYEAIKAATPSGAVNRAHIGMELTRLGYTETVREAFDRLLAPRCGYYHPPERMTSFECIAFIKSLGAAAVFAHPLLSLSPERTEEFLAKAVGYGLDGMETVYSTYDRHQQQTARALAERYSLKQSGGSDFHGEAKPDIHLGSGRGNLAVPVTFLDELKASC